MRADMNSEIRSKIMAIAVVVCLGLCGCHKQRSSAKVPPATVPPPAPPAAAPAPAPELVAPTLLSPAVDAAFHAYPRVLTLEWEPVPGALRYRVDIECYGCCAAHQFCYLHSETTSGTSYTLDNFVGDQPGRWRVRAISAAGVAGPPCDWRRFTFGRVLDGNIIPPVIPPAKAAEVVPCPADWHTDNFAGTTPPRAIYDPNAEYTDAARRERVNGSVALGVAVGGDGLVKEVCVLRGLRPDLDASAVGTVRTWRFRPAGMGAPSPAHLRVEMHFRLQ